MKVLVLAECYPRADDPTLGIWAHRQTLAARTAGGYLSPPRPGSYAHWGAWAAPLLRRALRRIRAAFPFDLINAHYAVPAGDAVRRGALVTPLVVSVHGGDVLGVRAGAATVRATFKHARLGVANSAGTARRCQSLGGAATQVVHLGTELPARPAALSAQARETVAGEFTWERCEHETVAVYEKVLRG